MKTLIDTFVIAIYALVISLGGKYTLKTIHDQVQMMALEKAAIGLGSMEKIARNLTTK
ncbi:MAG: hypothetical protein N4A33_10795 [Bacteriovoracaceae bacterium]|jgi:hypothetical protein|nr:hypothetical protein [Bacteriovoracaceae bacterium]